MTWKDGTLRFIREMGSEEEGTLEVVFEGRLSDKGLQGKLSAADFDLEGSWSATKKKKSKDL